MEWSHPARDHSWGQLRTGKTLHFWKCHAKTTLAYTWGQIFLEIWASKSSKYIKILTFCPLFELQKAVLGELTFEGSNQLQIQKFQLGWKVDSQAFPMSYLAPDVDTRKALKHSCKGARPLQGRGATTQGNFASLTISACKTQFLLLLTLNACK